MKRLLLLITLLLLASPALAESSEPSLTIELQGQFVSVPPLHVTDEDFLHWLEPLLAADDPCLTPVELMPAHHRFLLTFSAEDGTQTQYGIWHDTLYEQATVTHPDGTLHHLPPDVPALLYAALYDSARFDLPESHRALLAGHGWTPIYRMPYSLVRLPDVLQTSRTDASALYFTWADLFLRAGGYDITPYLGEAVVPYVYRVYERVNRVVWSPDDVRLLDENGEGGVMYGMYAIVLEHGGEVIGAYMMADSLNTATMLTLDGRSPSDLLGSTTLPEYLLSKLPITAEEQALAALTPEEVIQRYASAEDPRLMDIQVLLGRLVRYGRVIPILPLAAVPTGTEALSVKALTHSPGFYEVRVEGGIWFPEMILESPETGWKIVHFYNSGF